MINCGFITSIVLEDNSRGKMQRYFKLEPIEKGYEVAKTNRIHGFDTSEYFAKLKATDYFVYKLVGKKDVTENQIFFDGAQIVLPKRVACFLESLNLEGTQLLPSKIEKAEGGCLENYFRLHVFHKDILIDFEKSEYKYDFEHELFDEEEYTKLVLSAEKLTTLYQSSKLILKVEESGEIIFHKLLVEKIEQFGITGARFVDVEV